jgi:hypothetical protein
LDHITTNVTTHFEPTDYAGLNPMSYRLAHQRPLVPPVVQLLTNGFGRTKQK